MTLATTLLTGDWFERLQSVPLLAFAYTASRAMALAIGLARYRLLAGARAWIVVWLALDVLVGIVSIIVALRSRNNLWVIHATLPLYAIPVFAGISLWQPTARARTNMRRLGIVVVAWWAVTLALLEDIGSFSAFGYPFYYLASAVASLWTIAQRTMRSEAPAVRQDWFWILAGIATSGIISAGTSAVAAVFLDSDPMLVRQAIDARSVLEIVAGLAIVTGMLSRPDPNVDGGS